ncbi:MAG: response regulator [Ktedonobacteraceae bacterium]|nr:response regulator [Ktedonobacteraceae bacterium]
MLVIVVDDSPTIRKILEVGLGREGFTVLSFPDGVELLRWLVGPQGCAPDAIILDVRLPKIDGYKLAMRLRKRPEFRHTAMLMLSRYGGMKDRLFGRLAGAKEYLVKPVPVEEITAALRRAIGQQRCGSQLQE